MRKVYRSKIGTLYLAGLCILLIPLLAMLYREDYISTGLLTFALVFAIYLYFATLYIIEGDRLIVTIGFLGKRIIPIKDITSIRPTNSLLSAAAFSVKGRLQIEAGKNRIIVAPKNPDAFCADLREINPEIDIPLFMSDKSCCD
ncbi:MAG: PH domain-containing protein [Flavipsychrobacter sp.]